MKQAQSPFCDHGDNELVAACCAGRKEAFGELVTRYQDRVFNLAFRLTGNRDDAADMAQEAFMKAYRAMTSFRGDSGFYTWIFRIVINTVRSRQRFQAVRPKETSLDKTGSHDEKPGRRHAPVNGLADAGAGPDEEVLRAERCRLVGEAIAHMNEEQRVLIVLRDIEGHDYAEIADLLDCPRGTVKSRLHRARAALKDMLCNMFGEEFFTAGGSA